jgi:hypothetical protein
MDWTLRSAFAREWLSDTEKAKLKQQVSELIQIFDVVMFSNPLW